MAMLTAIGTTRASAPSVEEMRWSESVQTLAGVLAEVAERDRLASIAVPQAWIAPFDMNRTEALTVLPDRLPTTVVVSARAYLHPAVSAASDIVNDLTADGTIDASLLRKLVPNDPATLRQADATMARWFASALDASEGDPVAVLVLYDNGKSQPTFETEPKLTFILVRGEFDASRIPRVSRALYGPMQSAVK